jgi:hypothetical protein
LRSRPARSLAVTLVAALGFAAAAFAGPTISSTATPSFSVALNGADQTETYQLAFTISDTGSGKASGWNVSASATQFVNGSYTFPTNATSVTGVSPPVSCSGGNCSLPVPSGSITYPATLPNTGGSSIYSTEANTGEGTNVMTATMQVAAPANIYAGTYTSTVTLQVATGP